jgi:hypothetical protein
MILRVCQAVLVDTVYEYPGVRSTPVVELESFLEATFRF